MGIKTTAALAVALGISIVSASALANEDRGGYIGLSIGGTAYNDDNKLRGYDLDDSGFGWTAFGGYRIFRYFGVEAGYTNFGEFKASGVGNDTKEKFQALYLAAVGILPLGEAWQLRGRLGGGSMKLEQSFSNQEDADDTGATVMLGFGGQWAPTSLNGLAFNLNLDTYVFTVEQAGEDYSQSTSLLSLGLQYDF